MKKTLFLKKNGFAQIQKNLVLGKHIHIYRANLKICIYIIIQILYMQANSAIH